MNEEKSSKTNIVITVIAIVGGFAIGRFFGLLGVGALAIGWFVYDKTKENLGIFMAICAGAVSGLAAYGLAVIALFS